MPFIALAVFKAQGLYYYDENFVLAEIRGQGDSDTARYTGPWKNPDDFTAHTAELALFICGCFIAFTYCWFEKK